MLAPATTLAQEGGGVGAACGARADCAVDLHCLKHKCVDRQTFDDSLIDPAAVRPFLGVMFGGHLPSFLVGDTIGLGPHLGLRGGWMTNRWQFALEVAPSAIRSAATINDWTGLVEATANFTAFIRLNDFTSWIARIGGGGALLWGVHTQEYPNVLRPAQPLGEVRLDLVGVMIRTSDHAAIEINVPSYRLFFGSQVVFMTWVTAIGYSYVF